jgi:hypothetical protein
MLAYLVIQIPPLTFCDHPASRHNMTFRIMALNSKVLRGHPMFSLKIPKLYVF